MAMVPIRLRPSRDPARTIHMTPAPTLTRAAASVASSLATNRTCNNPETSGENLRRVMMRVAGAGEPGFRSLRRSRASFRFYVEAQGAIDGGSADGNFVDSSVDDPGIAPLAEVRERALVEDEGDGFGFSGREIDLVEGTKHGRRLA